MTDYQAEKPKYFSDISESDQDAYTKLRQTLSSPACKNRRNKSQETFAEVIQLIKQFVVRDEPEDLKRSLVCGIVWLPHSIAINTHQLRLLTSKCKSSINGSFQSLGYGTIPTGADSAGELLNVFPFLRNNFPELRQWTVRQKLSDTPSPARLTELLKAKIAPKAPEQPGFPMESFETPPPDFPTQMTDDFSIGFDDTPKDSSTLRYEDIMTFSLLSDDFPEI